MKKYIYYVLLACIIYSCNLSNDMKNENNHQESGILPVLGARLLKLNNVSQQIEYIENNKKSSSSYTESYLYSCDFPRNKVIQQQFSKSEENKLVSDLVQNILFNETSKPQYSNNSDQSISEYTYNETGNLESYAVKSKSNPQKVIYNIQFEYDEFHHVKVMQDLYTRIEFKYSPSENFRWWTTYILSGTELKKSQTGNLLQLFSGIEKKDWVYLYKSLRPSSTLETRSNQWIPVFRSYASYDFKLNNPYTALNFGFKGNENILFPISSHFLKSYKVYETDENGNETNLLIERNLQVIKSNSYYPFKAFGSATHYEYDERGIQSIRATESAIIEWKYQYSCNDQM